MGPVSEEILNSLIDGMTRWGLNASHIDVSVETEIALSKEMPVKVDPDILDRIFGVPVRSQDVLAARFRVVFPQET